MLLSLNVVDAMVDRLGVIGEFYEPINNRVDRLPLTVTYKLFISLSLLYRLAVL